jgi:hypothetical protein
MIDFFANILGVFWWIVFGISAIIFLCMTVGTTSESDGSFLDDVTLPGIQGFFGALMAAILAGKFIGGFFPILLGLIGGAFGGFLLNGWLRERAGYKRYQEIAELEALEAETIKTVRTLPLEERLAAIEKLAKEKNGIDNENLENASREYTSFLNKYSGQEPEVIKESFNSERGLFNGMAILISGEDKRLNGLVDLSKYYNQRLNVAKYQAIMSSNNYTVLREKALAYVENVKEIMKKWSVNERELFDNARLYGIKDINSERINVDIDNIVDPVNTNIYERDERDRAERRLLNEINRIEKNRLDIEAFNARISEINKSMQKAITAFKKIFTLVNNLIRNESESIRASRVEKGGNYFSNEEQDEIIKIFKGAVALLEIVDAKL